VLAQVMEIRGSADAPDMANYFLEFRPLDLREEADETDARRPWFPATLPQLQPVTDGVLGLWNTTTVPDGLYELRLTVNVRGDEQRIFRVSPLRVDNANFQPPVAQATPTDTFVRPTLPPTPTGLPGSAPNVTIPIASPTGLSVNSPRVEATTNANVRSGDDTIYPRIASLTAGQTAPVLGISSTGSGWYYIQLPNGRTGFIAPSTVRALGDFSQLSQITPPPRPTQPPRTPTPVPSNTPPATATLVPTAGPVASSANLAITSVVLNPAQPRCGENFTITATIINNGAGSTPTSFTVRAVDVHNASGKGTGATTGGIPALPAGGSFVSVMNLTVNTFFEEGHTLSVRADPDNIIGETNEGDNVFSVGYTLATAGC
jgi:hypothetical protein